MELIDIILLTHNHLENTTRCIEALYLNTTEPFKITVIDDSTDETEAYFHRLIAEGKSINYIRPDIFIRDGYQAINIGLGLTQSNPVVFLANSTWVEPNWLTMGLQLMRTNPKIGLVGCKVLFPETNTIMEAGEHVFPDTSRVNVGMHELSHRFTHIREVNSIGWGSGLLIRREAIPPGGFNEDYYIPWRCVSDWDACLEIKQRGWKIYYNGFGVVYHKLGRCTGEGTEQGQLENNENIRRFEEKWKGKVPPIK